MLAAEILYQNDLEAEVLLPAMIASIVGYSIFGYFSGWNSIFAVPSNLGFTSPPQLAWYGLLGLLCGLIGRDYASGFYGLTRAFSQLKFPRWLKPALGGLLVGLIGLLVPQVLGMDYGWVQLWMGEGLAVWPLWILLLLSFLKIIATDLSIGSGGSGGIFGPGMVIGAAVGAAFWRLGYPLLPGLPATPAPLVIVAMMALFGGIAYAPLAVILMVTEMTGNLSLLAPAMLAVSLALLVVGQQSIYRSQLATRADSPAHRRHFTLARLTVHQVQQALLPPQLVLTPDLPLSQAEAQLKTQQFPVASVADAQGRWLGTFTLAQVQQVAPAEREQRRVAEVLGPQNQIAVTLSDSPDRAQALFSQHCLDCLPVVETRNGSPHLIGYLTTQVILQAYRTALAAAPSQEGRERQKVQSASQAQAAGHG